MRVHSCHFYISVVFEIYLCSNRVVLVTAPIPVLYKELLLWKKINNAKMAQKDGIPSGIKVKFIYEAHLKQQS